MAIAGLIATLLCFLLGPALLAAARRKPTLGQLVDNSLPWLVAALVLVELLEDFSETGWLITGTALLLGLALPSLAEFSFRRYRREAHLLALALAILGLAMHAVADGSLLAAETLRNPGLAAAIALHSVPVGATIWWLTAPNFGPRIAAGLLGFTALATISGYVAGPSIEGAFGPHYWALFRAMVAGSLLHVVFGNRHLHRH